VEHIVPLVADQACVEALAILMTAIFRGDVSKEIADLLSSATLVILLKKDAETMVAMKEALGADYVQLQRPLGMGSTLVNIASNCALTILRSHGWDKCPTYPMAAACLDGINAFGDRTRLHPCGPRS
jgi:hypothetical protein